MHELFLGKSSAKEILPTESASAAEPRSEQNEPYIVGGEEKAKPRRGRPKVYIDKAPPTATERSKQSIKSLAAAGGKRVMLRLSPDAHEALKVIMAIMGGKQETAAINQALVAHKDELLRASTQK